MCVRACVRACDVTYSSVVVFSYVCQIESTLAIFEFSDTRVEALKGQVRLV